jgi:mannosyltransferase OCH1-like enzyme
MVEIYNDVSSIEELIEKHNEIYLYGAGASCRLLLMSYWQDVLKGHVKCIIDAKKELSGTSVSIGMDQILIKDIATVSDEFKEDRKKVLLLTPAFSSMIIEQLDIEKAFEGAKVYLLPMLCRRQQDSTYQLRSEKSKLIPKIIHYFWFGGNPVPEEYQKNIDGWKRLNPEYEIRCWNEDNYDFSSIAYTKEAYQSGKEFLMFVTDYARLDVLYRYGGIYLDTDVELIKPLDELLYNKAFIGIEENSQLNSGSAIGAVPGHQMIRKLMECYEKLHFLDESGKIQKKFNTYHETKCFIENGYRMVNKYQVVNDMVCFPRDLFMPICFAGMEDCYTEKTISVHKINPEECELHRKAYEKWKDRIR